VTEPVTAAPGIGRRLAALLYEALLLLALLLIVSFPFAGMKGALLDGWPRLFFQLYLVGVVSAYFTWFWRNGGQTLPMKTWRIRLVALSTPQLSVGRAIARIFCAVVLYGPACAGVALMFFPGRVNPALTVLLFVPMVATWWWARFDPDRQFLHDRIAGTRQISVLA